MPNLYGAMFGYIVGALINLLFCCVDIENKNKDQSS